MSRLVIAVVAGDAREVEIARCAVRHGAEVRGFGFPAPAGGIEGVRLTGSAAEALAGAEVALFPIPGIAADGALYAPKHDGRIILSEDDLSLMRRPGHVILGWADARLRAIAGSLDITLHEYEWDEDLMLLRGPAIVEGMLRAIIENTEITIHRARIVMVGHGTIGALATRALIALGGRVAVVARNPRQRAEAYAAGADPYDLADMEGAFAGAGIVVSSVPAQIVKEPHLTRLAPGALLVDLAAPPGGIDRDAAARLGQRFVWARGLGARAPITVGRSQWTGIARRLAAIRVCEPV